MYRTWNMHISNLLTWNMCYNWIWRIHWLFVIYCRKRWDNSGVDMSMSAAFEIGQLLHSTEYSDELNNVKQLILENLRNSKYLFKFGSNAKSTRITVKCICVNCVPCICIYNQIKIYTFGYIVDLSIFYLHAPSLWAHADLNINTCELSMRSWWGVLLAGIAFV